MKNPRLRWLHGFLVASALLISVMVIISGLAVAWFFEHQLLAREGEQVINLVQGQARQHLAPSDFDLPRWSGTRKAFETFSRDLPGIVRVTVYDRTGRIVWSEEPQLIGRAFPENVDLVRALKGNAATVIRGDIAGAYVPITFPQVPGVVGVIETYRDVTQLVAGIRWTQRFTWGVAGGMGLFLYLGLALIVWNASVREQRATTGIREAHEQLAAIMEAIADRMVIIDRQMRLVWMNSVSAQAYDVAGGALGLSCFEVLGGQPGVCEICPAVRTFESGKVERDVRVERLPGGAVRYLDVVSAPLHDASGVVQQVLEVARDITERVELEERLKWSAQELQRANEALREAQVHLVEKERLAAAGQVVVGLHHEILNPLTGVLGALQVLKHDGIAQPDKALALEEAEAAIRKIEQLVRRLATLRRAADAPYVGDTTMLDLERSCAEEERT
ncbi:MAG: hypothetical protein A2X52_04600 [Candidatus Rokubacteria bacterium GWC2_70_16]|nr:MAG: hypothetical protein A2X52_04600 [Candidatus Rokubacteria bacterium GWC2_70_16]OGL15366.1 MAG: hypothetical protein A3K12_04725 [Candidatus Rokubacteria bacterium RIFCSPLOWO2_12_FULL_71_19]